MRRTFALLALFVLPASLLAQIPASTHVEEMKKLEFMVGDWKGQGWIITPDGKRTEFVQTETVERKLGGQSLLVEGAGRDKATDALVFEAVGLIFFDAQAKHYWMHSGTNQGMSGISEMKPVEGGLQWAPVAAAGKVRYTIRLTDKGAWHEVGEYSPDGSAWSQFFEMTLDRVQ